MKAAVVAKRSKRTHTGAMAFWAEVRTRKKVLSPNLVSRTAGCRGLSMLVREVAGGMVGDEIGSGLVGGVDETEEEKEESLLLLFEVFWGFCSACSDAMISLKRRIVRVLVGLLDLVLGLSVGEDRAGESGWNRSPSSLSSSGEMGLLYDSRFLGLLGPMMSFWLPVAGVSWSDSDVVLPGRR